MAVQSTVFDLQQCRQTTNIHFFLQKDSSINIKDNHHFFFYIQEISHFSAFSYILKTSQHISHCLQNSCTITLRALWKCPPYPGSSSEPLRGRTLYPLGTDHSRVSRSGLKSEARINWSQCIELLSSFRRELSSPFPLVRAFFSSLFICLLSKANPRIHSTKDIVLKPSVRPRYNIL